MTPLELIALSLGLSVLLAGAAYVLSRVLEAWVADPVVRDWAWGASLYAAALPLLLVAAITTQPPAVIVGTPVDGPTGVIAEIETSLTPGAAAGGIGEPLALGVLLLAGLASALRAVSLARRTLRLRGLIEDAVPAPTDVQALVDRLAVAAGVHSLETRVSTQSSDTLVAGLRQPVLLLPAALVAQSDTQTLQAVCAHELAHIRRGDHRTVWSEEALLILLAFNPVMGLIRDSRAAAREEACDAAALAEAGEAERRRYARSLVEALRAASSHTSPALTFTSRRRTYAMRRVKAILSPAPTSGVSGRTLAVGLGVALAAVGGASSLALAENREVVIVPVAADVVEASTAPGTLAAPTVAAITPDLTPAPAAPSPRIASSPIRPAEGTSTITNPSWTRPPTPTTYPAAAMDQGVSSGSAEVSCAVLADGRVSDCGVVSETPEGAGFGQAAVAAAAEARLSPRTVDSVPVGGTVRFTIRFRMAAD
jgi:TonB family protein